MLRSAWIGVWVPQHVGALVGMGTIGRGVVAFVETRSALGIGVLPSSILHGRQGAVTRIATIGHCCGQLAVVTSGGGALGAVFTVLCVCKGRSESGRVAVDVKEGREERCASSGAQAGTRVSGRAVGRRVAEQVGAGVAVAFGHTSSEEATIASRERKNRAKAKAGARQGKARQGKAGSDSHTAIGTQASRVVDNWGYRSVGT